MKGDSPSNVNREARNPAYLDSILPKSGSDGKRYLDINYSKSYICEIISDFHNHLLSPLPRLHGIDIF